MTTPNIKASDDFIPARAYRDAAFILRHRDGEIEIDDPADEDYEAMISRGDDPGAYVKAWVWVPEEDARAAMTAQAEQNRQLP